jgi:putative hydrolase of the HAD superfamily
MNFDKYNLVIFDLDNTLYEENNYLFKSYQAIATYLSKKDKNLSEGLLLSFLKEEFISSGRNNILNKLFENFKIKNELNNCLSIMRDIQLTNKIPLNKKTKFLLAKAIEQSKVCVLTNGNVQQQQNKISQIDWGDMDSKIDFIYANKYEPKPSPKSYENYIKKTYNILPQNILMIGNSITDKIFANNIGCIYLDINL